MHVYVHVKEEVWTHRLAPERFSRMKTFTSEGNACVDE